MTSDTATSAPENNEDHWPTFTLGPTDYEKAVEDIARTMSHEVTDWRVEHLDPVEGLDGTYTIDVTARFRLAGMDFLILFECKRHASAVKREHVQVLHTKMQSTGAHKGVLVAASGFQSGALQYARGHGIACVRLVDNAWTYQSRTMSTRQPTPQPTGTYTGFAIHEDDESYAFTMLTGCPDHVRDTLLS